MRTRLAMLFVVRAKRTGLDVGFSVLEPAGLRIAGLRLSNDGANFGKAEADTAQCVNEFADLTYTSGRADETQHSGPVADRIMR